MGSYLPKCGDARVPVELWGRKRRGGQRIIVPVPT